MTTRSARGTMSNTTDPEKMAIVMIPGAYCVPDQYEKVAAYCRSFGSEVIVVQNPSTAGPASLYDDAANARRHVESLVRRGKEVMIVGHGYGAMVASQCCQRLSKAEIMDRGAGGVVRLLFIAGVVGSIGQSTLDAMGGPAGLGMPDGMVDGFNWYHPERLSPVYYSGARPDDAIVHAAQNTPQSARSLNDPLTYAGYLYLPVTYMVTEGDSMIPLVLQEAYVSLIQSMSGQIVDALHYPTDHFPSVTRPEAVIDCIRRAAGEESFESCNWL